MQIVIIPLNEGQDLNYYETATTVNQAKERGKELVLSLNKILIHGDISCKIEIFKDKNCKELVFDVRNNKWYNSGSY